MKIVFQFEPGRKLQSTLEGYTAHGLNVCCVPDGNADALMQEAQDCDAIWHVLGPITDAVMAASPKLKLIQKIGVGVNTIDLKAAEKANIVVCNMPGTNSQAVAEMTLLLMLSAIRLQPRIDKLCRSGVWQTDLASRESFSEIHGKTVGFVGFGHVPQILSPILSAMGANVIYTSRSEKLGDHRRRSLDEVVSSADILSLHVPLTDDTAHLIDRDRLAAMKPNAVLVNTARGGLVDEAALYQALQSGELRAAGLDVFATEPVHASNPLLSLDNVAVSPHLAWLTQETLSRSLEIAVKNTLAIRDSTPLLHQVN